jgi:hypothetical protein
MKRRNDKDGECKGRGKKGGMIRMSAGGVVNKGKKEREKIYT